MSRDDPVPSDTRADPAGITVSGFTVSGFTVFGFTVFGNLFLVVSTVILGILACLIGWIPPRGALVYSLARWWSRGLLWASGVEVKAHFEEHLDAGEARVFMANHQSLYDIPVLIATLPGSARFLAKRSLFRIPVFGWALYAGGFVPVDRGDRKAARATVATATRRLRRGSSLVIFPEETRSTDGKLRAFKRGGPILALRTGFPVVPVGIRGTLAVRSKKSFVIRPGVVEVGFGRSMSPADYGLSGKVEFTRDIQARVARLVKADPGEQQLAEL